MGLVGMMARTAVVAGTATAVSNRVSRRQVNRWNNNAQQQAPAQEQAPPEQYQQAPPSAAAPAAPPDLLDQLKQLSTLKNQGVLSEDEFTAAKAKLLGTS